MEPVVRRPLPDLTARGRLIAVLRSPGAEDYEPLLEALYGGGLRSAELTLTTPGTLDALRGVAERWGGAMDIGVGTVTSPEHVRSAAAAGARYLVTPTTDPDVLRACQEVGIPFLPGGLTPTELSVGWRAGAAAVKVFPASRVGPSYVGELKGPFPDLRCVPSGGVDQEEAARWLEAGADAVSVGGPILRDVADTRDYYGLRRRTAALVSRLDAVGRH